MDLQNHKKKVAFAELAGLIEEKLELGEEVEIPASGNSMYPLFRHGKDSVRLQKIVPGTLQTYDMVLYQRDCGSYILHRIVGIKKDGYVLRGDAQYANEYPVREDQMIAKVSSFCRNGRRICCTHPAYRIYARVWCGTFVLRKVGSALKRRAMAVIRPKTDR